MRRFYTVLWAILFVTPFAQGQSYFQGFEGTLADNLSYTENPSTYTASGDVWAITSSVGPINPLSGGNQWSMQDLNNPNGGGAFAHTLTFTETVSGTYNISFGYYIEGFDTSNGDEASYEVIVDGTSQGVVSLTASSGTSGGWQTETITGLTPTSSLELILSATQNGGSDYAAWDDIAFTAQSTATATADPATNISTTAADLNGTVNDNNDAVTNIEFRYGTTAGGPYSTTVAATPNTLASGSGATAVTTSLTGLMSGTTYYYVVVATNGQGTTTSTEASFTTVAVNPPTVAADPATNITTTAADLNGTVNDNNDAVTNIEFRYGTTAGGPYATTVAATPNTLASGSGATAVTASLTGLASSTTYYYVVVATNGQGTETSTEASFTTLTPVVPCVELFISEYYEDGSDKYLEIYNPTSSAINLAGYEIDIYFNSNSSSGSNIALSGTIAADDVFVIADNGSTAGITADLVDKNLEFNGNDAIVLSNGGTTIDIMGAIGSGNNYGETKVLRRLSTIQGGNTTYDAAEWDDLSVTATDFGAHTSDCAPATPIVTADPATAVGPTSATLNGTVDDNGDNTTGIIFRYGTSMGGPYSSSIAPATTTLASGAGATAFSANLTGLTTGTTYYYIIEASNSGGTEQSSEQSFTPEVPHATNFAFSCVSNSSITLTWDNATTSDGVLVLAREGSNPPHTTSSLTPAPGQAFGTNYGSAPTFGSTAPNSRVVYNGMGNTATVTGLSANTDYIFEVHNYAAGAFAPNATAPDLSATIELPEVSSFNAAVGNASVDLAWVLPTPFACYDEVLIIANDGPVTTVPTGDGSAYTANADYSAAASITGNERAIYQGVGAVISVTGLTNATTYHFKAFVRSGTEWSQGIEITATPANITEFAPGDLAIVGFDANASGADDAFSIVTLVDILPGTQFIVANTSYESGAAPNVRTDTWDNDGGEPSIQTFTLAGTTPIAAGSIISFLSPGTLGGGAVSDVRVNGVPSPDLTSTFSGNASSAMNISTSNPDQIHLMQGSFSGTNLESFTGTVIWGQTNRATWDDITTTPPNRESRLHPEVRCFNYEAGTATSAAFDYSVLSSGSRRAILGAIRNATNWNTDTTYTNTNTFTVTAGNPNGTWLASTDNNWFDCENWEGYFVPTDETDVFLDANSGALTNIDFTAAFSDEYQDTARCANLTIENHSVDLIADRNNVLIVNGDLTLNTGGLLNMDDGTAANDGQIYLYGNWMNNDATAAFDEGQSLVRFLGSADQSIGAAATVETFHDVAIDKTAGLLSNAVGELQIAGNFNFVNGIVNNPAGNDLLFNDGATATGASDNSYVAGLVIKETSTTAGDTFTFPIGDNNIYGALGIETQTGAGEFFEAGYTNVGFGDYTTNTAILDHVSQREHWTLTDVIGGAEAVRVTLHWGAHSNVFDVNELHVAHFQGGQWESEGVSSVTGTVASGTVTSSNFISTFSPFTLGSTFNNVSLPLELLRFNAERAGTANRLYWEVASAENMQQYELWRSEDGLDFEQIGTVATVPYRIENQLFEWMDEQPLNGLNYYRLRGLELDGVEHWSDVRVVERRESQAAVRLFPNPVGATLELRFAEASAQTQVWQILNGLGQVVAQGQLAAQQQQLQIDVEELPAGTYFLRMPNRSLPFVKE